MIKPINVVKIIFKHLKCYGATLLENDENALFERVTNNLLLYHISHCFLKIFEIRLL